MNGIDWSKAPEGTTGAMVAQFGNSSIREGAVEFVPRGNWQRSDYVEGPDAWVYIEKPTTWAGEGLPPVGTVCEYIGEKHGLEFGAPVEIIHHFHAGAADVAVFIYSKGIGMGRHVAQSIAENFRPIRTPEQIAAEERLDRVHAIEGIMIRGQEQALTITQIAAAIDDAGYRKQVQP